MSTAAPPAWVKALALPSGQWRFLVTAWGWGPFGNASPDAKPLPKAVKVTASIRTIGARSGQSRATAAKQSLALCAAGWMRREPDDSLTLASWRFPHIFDLEAAVDEGIVIRDGNGALSWREMRGCPGAWLPDGRAKCQGPNCSRCTGSGLVAVTRSQLATLDGSTQPPHGPPGTAEGATPGRSTPRPHTVHPGTAQGSTQPPHGPQSYLSCSSSNYPKEEAREPLPPPPRHQDAQTSLVTGKPWTPPAPQTADEQAIVWGSQASAQAQLKRERDDAGAIRVDNIGEYQAAVATHRADWAAKVRKSSESAAYHLDQSDGPAPSYGGLMAQARANYGDEQVLAVLRAWELDGARPTRPPANKLWWRSWVPWVEAVLGITAPKSEAAETKRSPNGQAAFEAVMAKVEARKLAVVP